MFGHDFSLCSRPLICDRQVVQNCSAAYKAAGGRSGGRDETARGGASAHLNASLTTILSAEERQDQWLPLAIALIFVPLKAQR